MCISVGFESVTATGVKLQLPEIFVKICEECWLSRWESCKDVLLWGLGFHQRRNRLNQAFKSDSVRLLGIIASILTLLRYEGQAEIHKNNSVAADTHHFVLHLNQISRS